MEKDTLRMQFLSGVITESEYKVKLNENVAVAEVRRAMEAAIAKIKNPTDIERRINNVKFVVYNSLDPNTNGGERPPSDFQFDDAWWDSTHSQATDSVIASIYGELDAAVKGKSFGEDPMNENKSLNESMIGGIVGIGAINQIPPRAKADYETAFEHFLGEKYGLNEVEIEEVEELEEELEEGKEEVVLSNEILNFLEERGIIDPSDAQKVHTDLTAFLNKLSKNPTPDRILSKSDYIAGIEENEEESN
jgi:hypothetical protein